MTKAKSQSTTAKTSNTAAKPAKTQKKAVTPSAPVLHSALRTYQCRVKCCTGDYTVKIAATDEGAARALFSSSGNSGRLLDCTEVQ